MSVQNIKKLREDRQKELNQIAGEIAAKSNAKEYDMDYQEQIIPTLESLLQKTYETYHIKIKKEIENGVAKLRSMLSRAESKEEVESLEAELKEIEAQAKEYEIEILYEVLSVGGLTAEKKLKVKERLLGLGVTEESVDQHISRNI